MTKNRKKWVLYCRSFLITMGSVFTVFSLWFAVVNIQRNEFFSTLPISLFIGFIALGLVLINIGVYGANNKIEKWANATSKHWITFFIMLLSYPVYLILEVRPVKTLNLANLSVTN